MCERWVGDWTNYNILTPSSFTLATLLSCSTSQSGVLRAHSPLLGAGSLYIILYPTNWLQITELPVAPDYIIVLRPPASCERRIITQFNSSTVKVIPCYLRPDAPVPWLKAGLTVNMLQFDSTSWVFLYLCLSVPLLLSLSISIYIWCGVKLNLLD